MVFHASPASGGQVASGARCKFQAYHWHRRAAIAQAGAGGKSPRPGPPTPLVSAQTPNFSPNIQGISVCRHTKHLLITGGLRAKLRIDQESVVILSVPRVPRITVEKALSQCPVDRARARIRGQATNEKSFDREHRSYARLRCATPFEEIERNKGKAARILATLNMHVQARSGIMRRARRRCPGPGSTDRRDNEHLLKSEECLFHLRCDSIQPRNLISRVPTFSFSPGMQPTHTDEGNKLGAIFARSPFPVDQYSSERRLHRRVIQEKKLIQGEKREKISLARNQLRASFGLGILRKRPEEQMPTQFHASNYEIHDLREPHHSLPIQGGMGVPGYDCRSRMFSTPCNNDGSNNAAAAAASSSEVAAYAWSKTTTRGPKAASDKGGGKPPQTKGSARPSSGRYLTLRSTELRFGPNQ
eukprot:Gb_01749 [translate_table: standard]